MTQSGSRLLEIVSSVKRVTDIVDEIAAIAREQANGMDQVSKAISQIDTVTQNGAASSEELSGTAEALSRQSSELLALVGRFKVGDETAAARAARP